MGGGGFIQFGQFGANYTDFTRGSQLEGGGCKKCQKYANVINEQTLATMEEIVENDV